jgi:hypothetical protein
MKKLLLPLLLTGILSPAIAMADNHDDRKRMHEMTDTEKEAFFDDKIQKMESDIQALKGMTLEEKEDWFKNKKRHMKKKHKHMKKACEELNSGKEREFDYDKAKERMTNSPKFQNSSKEKQEKMLNRLEEFNNLSPEEKQEKMKKKKEKLQKYCNNKK